METTIVVLALSFNANAQRDGLMNKANEKADKAPVKAISNANPLTSINKSTASSSKAMGGKLPSEIALKFEEGQMFLIQESPLNTIYYVFVKG